MSQAQCHTVCSRVRALCTVAYVPNVLDRTCTVPDCVQRITCSHLRNWSSG
jgi:hypothetical protein